MPQNVFDQFDEETVETNVFDQFDVAEPAISPVEAPEATWGERAADIGIDLAKGTVGFGQSVVGLGSLATGGYLSDGMRALGYNPEETNIFLSDMYSEARKAEEEKISKAEGFVGTVKEIVTQPGALLGKIAETTPMMLGSIAAARLFAAKAFAAAEAEALAAGATKAAASKVGLEASAKAATTAAATAEGAQQAGMSFDDYMDKGIDLGKAYVASIGSGITTGLTSLFGGRVGQKFGLGDVEAGIGGRGGIISRAAKGGVQEGVLEEMPQSSMEQMWNNYANERPIMEGVPEAAGTGLVVGFGAGTGFGAFQKAPEEQTDQETKPPETFSPTHNVSGGVAAERATKNGRAIPDTYVDAAGKIIRDANAVPIPIPEYDPESYDLEQNAAAIEADVAAGAPTAEGRQDIIESIYGPSEVLRPGAAPGALDIARQAEIERTPLEISVEPVPVEVAEPGAPTATQPVGVREQVAQLEVEARESGITEPEEINQYVIDEIYGAKAELTQTERNQLAIDLAETGTFRPETVEAIAAPVEEPAVDVMEPVSKREEAITEQERQAAFEAEAIERGITEREMPEEVAVAEEIEAAASDLNLGDVVSDLSSRISALDPSLVKGLPKGVGSDAENFRRAISTHPVIKQFKSFIKIPAKESSGHINSFIDESISDGLAADAHLFGNTGNAHAIRSQGFDSLDVKTQSMVKRHMLSSLQDREVFDSVVKLIPVNVMNMLTTEQADASVLLNNQSMFLDSLSVALDDPVMVGGLVDGIAASHPRALALAVTKKVLDSVDTGRDAVDWASAVTTVDDRQFISPKEKVKGIEVVDDNAVKKTVKEQALSTKAKGIKLEKPDMVERETTTKPLEEPTVTPEEITELPVVDYARFDGKEITYEVEIEETGETYTVTADAGKEMRDIDSRIESLNELMKCVS